MNTVRDKHTAMQPTSTPPTKRAGQELFERMVAVVKDYAIFMLDINGFIASWNEGARNIKGYEADEIIGSHFSRFYTAEDIQRGHPEEELAIATEKGRFEEEGWRVRKDGTQFWANVVITRVNDLSGVHIGFSKVTRDLTERRAYEESLKRMNENLEERVRVRTRELEIALNARDEFLSIASHELKTPLTSLLMQLQLARRRLEKSSKENPPQPELTQALDRSIKQTANLNGLVEELLDLSRIHVGTVNLNLESLNLSAVVETIIEQFAPSLAKAGCQIELHLESVVEGQWDRQRLGQVITNLTSNAIKYAPDTTIKITTKAIGNNAVFSIQDFGPGIDQANQQKIFERYGRVHPDRHIPGLGLGLFISRRIVEAHQGSIGVKSAPGEGSTFSVKLPRDLGTTKEATNATC